MWPLGCYIFMINDNFFPFLYNIVYQDFTWSTYSKLKQRFVIILKIQLLHFTSYPVPFQIYLILGNINKIDKTLPHYATDRGKLSYVNFIRFDVNGRSIGWHDGDVGQNKLLTQAIVVIRLLGLKHPRLFGYCNKCAKMRCLWMISHQNDILIPGLCCIYTP